MHVALRVHAWKKTAAGLGGQRLVDTWMLLLACGQSEMFHLSMFTSDTLIAYEVATGDNEMLSRFIGCAKLRPHQSVLKVNVKNYVF